MRELRSSIAAALRDAAESLAGLFGMPRAAWKGSPPSLHQTILRARDLLDDARYLPGPDHADSTYHSVLACLQEIDACLAFVHFLIGLEEDHPLRQRFFQVIGDGAEDFRGNLEAVAGQFQEPPSREAPVQWHPDFTGRWETAAMSIPPQEITGIDSGRPAVIARCLDQIASAVERISAIACEINARHAPGKSK
jgi:hypothetical protein